MSDNLHIILFPCLSDNYGFLIHDELSGQTAAIDTPEATEIAKQCEQRGWTLTDIWNTHWHPDHTGGNAALKAKYNCRITGPSYIEGRIPEMDRGVAEGDVIQIGDHKVHVLHTPGHTDEHIIYYVPDAKAAFVGDTIFTMGCGRLFEGTPQQMWGSLSKIMALPDETKLYCAHEYTLSNAKYALHAEPDNPHMQAAQQDAQDKRDQNIPTVPTTVAAERVTNPFITAGNADELGRRRAEKDSF